MNHAPLTVQIPTPDPQVQSNFGMNLLSQQSQDLIFLEDLTPAMDRQFQKSLLTPYFKSVFADLILRSAPPSDTQKVQQQQANQQANPNSNNDSQSSKMTIDKVTFLEYANLPGVLNDQFLAILMQQSSDPSRITENAFVNVLQAVFSCNLQSKLRIVFRMFDFAQRGSLNCEDVRLLMSYIPMRHKSNNNHSDSSMSTPSSFSVNSVTEKKKRSGSSLAGHQNNSVKKGNSYPNTNNTNTSGSGSGADKQLRSEHLGPQAEGLFTEGPNMNETERIQNQHQVDQFVKQLFEAATSNSQNKNAAKNYQMTFEDFSQMNTNVSSEMFLSVMGLFHERLPCAQYYFRQRKQFIERQIDKQSKIYLESQVSSLDNSTNLTNNHNQIPGSPQRQQQSKSVDKRKAAGISKDPTQLAMAIEKAEQVVFQPYKVIASPRLIKNWSGSPNLVAKRTSSFAPEATTGSGFGGSNGSKLEDDANSYNNDNGQRYPQQFIIRKNTGPYNKGSPRIQALNISKVNHTPKSYIGHGNTQQMPSNLQSQNTNTSTNSLMSIGSHQSGGHGRCDSPVVFVTQSKMRRLQDAKREWEQNHAPNSPFKVEKFSGLSNLSVGVQGQEIGTPDYKEGGAVPLANGKQQQMFNWQNASPGSNATANTSAQSIDQTISSKETSTKSTFNRTSSNVNGSPAAQPHRSRNDIGSSLSSKTMSNVNTAASPSKQFDKRKLPALTTNQDADSFLNESDSDMYQSPNLSQQYVPSCKLNSPIVDAFYDNSTHQKTYNRLEGTCQLKTKADRFKSHWALLDGHEIYCYRFKDDQAYRVMHSLAGTFLEQMEPEHCPDTHKKLFPVKIVLPPTKSRILYFENEEQQKLWQSRLKISMGYTNIFDFYETGYNLGKGQFGLVKFARHRKSKLNAAIKMIGKANMKPIEILQQRREIEVLKMCQNRGIIKLIDVFENSSHYYIVLEYLAGKDLFDYLQKRSFSIKEERCKEIGFQMVQAVMYLHSYGIVHRDLKLENVMMRDSSDKAEPVIVDFGLSKIIGPEQTANEPFGTLGYAAPEVLKKQPYSFSCDVWSLGCILYALLSGSLPFDHESQRETIRMTFEDELRFDLKCWKTISPSCKQLLTAMLTKDPAKRIKLKDVAEHSWFDAVKSINTIGDK